MKIAMIGTGYVGLVSGACLADFGHEVAAYDKDGTRSRASADGEMPIYEPGLAHLVERNVAAGRCRLAAGLDERARRRRGRLPRRWHAGAARWTAMPI